MRATVSWITLALATAAFSQPLTTDITVPAPVPGVPLQIWVDANPALPGFQRCTVETTPDNQLLLPGGLPPGFVDLAVDIRLLNPIELFPARRLHTIEFTLHFDATVVEPAPGFMNVPSFFGVDATPSWFVPQGAPPGTIRVKTGILPCPVGLPAGFLIYPGFNGLVARVGFNALKDGQTGFDVSDIVLHTTSNSTCEPVTLIQASGTYARSQVIINHQGPAVGCWTVNRTFDAPDVTPGDGIANASSTLGIIDATLSACIAEANARVGPDTISFDFTPVGAPIILATAPVGVSDLSGPLMLDGESQPFVQLKSDGASTGLIITSPGNEVRGMAFTGFAGAGMLLIGNHATGNSITACRIGVDWNGEPLANGHGILLVDGATLNTIGGDAADGNLIRSNASDGIVAARGNMVTGNSIRANAGLGLRVSDAASVVTIKSALVDAALTVDGALAGPPSTPHLVEVFDNLICDPTGFGEGAMLIGHAVIATNGAGTAAFTLKLPLEVDTQTPGLISLSATSDSGGTSEFSNCFIIDGGLNGCPGDLNGDELVTGADLAIVLGSWGAGGIGDINGDNVVDGSDLAIVLGNWGPCQ